MSTSGTDQNRVKRLIGVYNANGSLRGELAYWVGARLGARHCALCDITHARVRERSDWKECRAGLVVPFDIFHRDDQPDVVRNVAAGRFPIVVAETSSAVVVVLDPNDLAACEGSPNQMVDLIATRVAALGLEF